MSKFTIKRLVNGLETDVVVCDSLEYTGTWMGECFLTVSVKSAAPIDFHIGDYITYRDEKFFINYDPSVIKKARKDTYGEGFTYDGIKFNSRQSELSDIMFLDYVLGDNNIHYTSLPTFPFFANDIDDFCDRLQVNTNRWCEENNIPLSERWFFVTPNLDRTKQRSRNSGMGVTLARQYYIEAYGSETEPNINTENEKKNVSLSINNQTIWNSMSLIKSEFGLNFINRNRLVIIGSAGLPTAHIFKYGKGEGLSQIERQADTEQQVITKLYGYGSEKNMPVRYYANIGMRVYANVTEVLAVRDNTYIVRIDIPASSKYFIKPNESSTEDENVTYSVRVTDENEQFINTASVYAPTGDDTEDIGGNIGQITIPWTGTMTVNTKIYFVNGINKDNWDSAHKTHPNNLPNNMAVNCLMLPGFPSMSLYAWVLANGGVAVDDPYNEVGNVCRAQWTVGQGESAVTYDAFFSDQQYRPFVESLNSPYIGVREATKKFDGSDEDEEIYPTIQDTLYDQVHSVERIDDNGIFDDNVDTVDTFWMKFPIFPSDFDLEDLVALGDGPSVSMKDGYCAGRSFKISSVKKDGDRFKCELEREYDDLLQIYFPYSDREAHGQPAINDEPYQVRANDKYVFIGIPMTDTYINTASKKLLEKTLQYLQANDYVRYTFLPKVDEIWMAREHEENAGTEPHVKSTYETIKEGDLLHFKDTDLELEDAMVFIDTLNIKENGNSNIPTFDITLRNDKMVGTMQRLQNQINSLAGGGTGMGGYSSNQINNIVKGLGSDLFISKVKDDTAKGKVDFQKAIQIGRVFDSGLLGYGGIFRVNSDGTTYLEADQMYVRMKAYFDSVEIRKYEHSSGNRIASPAGLKCCKVVRYGEFEGNTVALDDDGYYHYIDPETEEEVSVHCDTIFFRCYYRAKDGEDTKENDYVVGDMAQCRITKVDGSLNMRYFWRLVVGKNADENESTLFEGEFGWIDLSNVQHNVIIDQTTGYKYDGYAAGSDVPQAGDDIFQLGNVRTRGRQGAIIEYTSGNDAPSYKVYQEIGKDDREEAQKTSTSLNPYTLTDKNFISIGYNSATGRADMKVWGDTFIGAKADPVTGISPTYIDYDAGTQKLRIKAILDLLSPLGNTGNSLGDFLNWNTSTINALIEDINAIKHQVDGSIETWFYDHLPVNMSAQNPNAPLLYIDNDPTKPNLPYYNWYMADMSSSSSSSSSSSDSEVTTERDKHLGDIFYSNNTGYAFRFSLNEQTHEFEWYQITDSAVIEALRQAAKAQDTADHKRRVFVVQPPVEHHDDGDYVEYDIGDMWVNATHPADGSTYNNDLLRCVTAKPVRDSQTGRITDGSFSILDWDLASKYTDDSRLIAFLDGYQGTLTTIQDQIDKKAETWYQNTDPENTWYDTQATPVLDKRSEHVGDLWYCTDNIYVGNVLVKGKGTTWYYQVVEDHGVTNYYWQQQDVPQQVFDDIDGKAAIYTAYGDARDAYDANPRELHLKDLLMPLATGLDIVRNRVYEPNKLYRCTNLGTDGKNSPLFEEIGYTDDSRFNAYINTLLNGNPSMTADPQTAAAVQYAIKNALGGGTVVDGGLLLTSLIAMRKWDGVGDKSWITSYTTWAGISGVYDDWSVTHAKGHGIAAWYGGAAVDLEDLTQTQQAAYDALSDAQKAASADYAKSLLRFDGSGYFASTNIRWTADGKVYLSNMYTGNNTPISQYFFDAFAIGIDGSTPYINPQFSFNHLDVIRRTGTGAVTLSGNSVLNRDENDARYLASSLFWTLFGVYSSDGSTDLTQTFISTGTLPTGAAIKARAGLFSDSFISALGLNPNSGGGGGGGTGDVTWTALASAPTGGRTIDYGYISAGVSAQGFATQSWVLSQGYITSLTSSDIMSALGFTISGTSGSTYNLNSFLTGHQTIYALSIYGGTTKVLDYTPNSAAASIYIKAGDGLSLTNDTTNKYITLSHPTNGANTTISAANGKVLSAITVNNLGHVTSVSSKTLAAADIPDISADYATSGRVTTLEGYFTNGVANNAARLTTVSKTAWGRTYWTANGVPDSISGDMSGVGEIEMSSLLKMANGQSIQFKDSGSNYRNVLTVNSLNDLAIGYGTRLQGYVTDIQGGRILFGVGTTRVEAMEITSAGQVQIKQGTQGLIVGNGTTGDYIQIGAIRIEYDNSNNNNALKIYKVVNGTATAANLYALGGISALGYGSSSGGGGGGTGDVTWAALASTPSSSSRFIDWGYIASAVGAQNYVNQTTLNTTLAGYLPLNGGGTVTALSGSSSPLSLKTGVSSGVRAYITFLKNDGTVAGRLGVNDGVPEFNLANHYYTIWHAGNFPLSISNPSSGQVLKFNGTNWVNDTIPASGGTVTSITLIAGTGISLDVDNTAITTSGSRTINISSTYQSYISHGESAYNSLSSYLPLSGGTMSGTIKWRNARTGIYNLGTTDTTPSGYIVDYQGGNTVMGLISWDGGSDEGGILVGSDNCTIYNSSDSGSVLKVMDKDVSGDLTGDYTAANCYLWVGSDGTTRAKELYEGTYRVITSNTIGSQSVNYASSAGSVDWSNVSGHPTAVSSFTNDSGYITSSGSCAYATSAGTATDSTKVLKAGDTMSGALTFKWGGNTSDQWIYFNSADDTESYRLGIRKGYSTYGFSIYDGDYWRIYTEKNANRSDTNWTCMNSIVNGNIKLSGVITDGNNRTYLGCDVVSSHTRYCSWMALPDNDADDMWQVRPFGGNRDNAYITVMHGGNVGIGTVSPSCKLDVYGQLRTYNVVNSVTNSIRLTPAGDPAIEMISNGGQWLHFCANGSSLFIYNGALNTSATGAHQQGITINTSNNIGIGNDSPLYKLDVSGGIHTTNDIYLEQGFGLKALGASSYRMIYGCDSADTSTSSHVRMTSFAMIPDNDADDCWQVRPIFGAFSDAYITVKHGGNVGIGTTSPSYPFHVVGNAYFANNISTSGTISVSNGTSSQFLKADGSVDSTDYAIRGTGNNLCWYTDEFSFLPSGFASTIVWINYRTAGNVATTDFTYIFANGKNDGGRAAISCGNIGCGNVTSSGYISSTNYISTSSYVSANGYTNGSANIMTGTYIGSGTYNILSWRQYSDHFEFEFPNTTDSYSGSHIPIYFGWRGGVYPFAIAANENVGIGTVSPSTKLHVVGQTKSSSGNNSIRLIPNSDCGIEFVTNGQWIHIAGNGSTMYIYNGAWDSGGTANYYKGISINSSNYVGIGVTNASYKLDVSGDVNVSGKIIIAQSGGIYSGPSDSNLRKIYGCDSSDGYYARMASYAMIPDNDSNDAWQVRPWSGTYTNAYVTVLHGGNVGIGTTSPAYKLHVIGDVGMTGVFQGAQAIKLNSDSTYHGSVHGGYIDFHYNGASSYTTRLIEGSSGVLSILGSGLVVGSSNGSYVQIGNIRIVYDSTNNALKIVQSDGSTSANLYATGGVSALGYGSSGGSGITVGDVTWSALSSGSDTRQIASSHLTTVLNNYVRNDGGFAKVTDGLYINSSDGAQYVYNDSGDLTLASDGGDVVVDNNLIVSGLLTVSDGGYDRISMSHGTGQQSGVYSMNLNFYEIRSNGYMYAIAFNSTSDSRLKDIYDYDAAIDLWDVAYAPAVHYKWKDNGRGTDMHVGSLAQYWRTICPEAVTQSSDGYLSMQYDVLALLSAISIAKKTIDHERRISELERENALLRYEIEQLKAA